MFDNIGAKIKSLAKVMCFIGIGLGIIAGISIIGSYYSDYDKSILAGLLLGVIYALLIGVVSWIGSFSLYGYGQHIEDTQAIRRIIESEQRKKLTENSSD